MAVTNRHPIMTPAGASISYVTRGGRADFVTGIRCSPEFAGEEFAFYQSPGERTYRYGYHTIQSFSPKDDITPEKAHEIGVRLAREVYDGYQCVVATHTEKGHIHNHIISNSVSFRTGEKMRDSLYDRSSVNRLREVSDRLCEEYGLNVLPARKIGKYRQYKSSVLRRRPLRILKRRFRNAFSEEMRTAGSYEELLDRLRARGFMLREENGRLSVMMPGIFKAERWFQVQRLIPYDTARLKRAFSPHPQKVNAGFVQKTLQRLENATVWAVSRILNKFSRVTRNAPYDEFGAEIRHIIRKEEISTPQEAVQQREALAQQRDTLLGPLENARIEMERLERLMKKRQDYMLYLKYREGYDENPSQELRNRNLKEITLFTEAEKALDEAGYHSLQDVKRLQNDYNGAVRRYNDLENKIDYVQDAIDNLDRLAGYRIRTYRMIVEKPISTDPLRVPVSNCYIEPDDYVMAGKVCIVPIEDDRTYEIKGLRDASGKEIVLRRKGRDLADFIRPSRTAMMEEAALSKEISR